MAKIMTQEELELHIVEAASAVTDLMVSLAGSEDYKNQKRAMLMGFWLKKYALIIKREPNFFPKSLPRYKRGQIVQADFGFRPGKELGGLHYAVVLDVSNDLSSHVVTVIPLLSYKEAAYKENRFTVLLKDGVFNALDSKLEGLIEQAQQLMGDANKLSGNPELARAKRESAKPIVVMAKNALEELKHLRAGTVANTCQITTISKMRITKPLNPSDAMYNVKVSDADMNLIYAQLKSLFLF